MTRAVALVRTRADLAAVRIAVGLGDTTVVALAPDGPEIEALLDESRTLGAIRCVRLWDDTLATTDFLGVAIALAATIRTAVGDLGAPPTVIVSGDQGRGAVGPALAERLGLPHLGAVIAAELVDGRVVARRREGEVERLYAGKPPLVLHVSATAAPPPTAAAGAAEAAGWTEAVATTEAWNLEKAGLTPHELAYRRRFRTERAIGVEPVRPRPKTFPSAEALAARLRDDGLCGSGQ